MNIDRPHPKDGEGNVFTGVRLSVGSGGGAGWHSSLWSPIPSGGGGGAQDRGTRPVKIGVPPPSPRERLHRGGTPLTFSRRRTLNMRVSGGTRQARPAISSALVIFSDVFIGFTYQCRM